MFQIPSKIFESLYKQLLISLCLVFISPAFTSATTTPLTFGLFPYTTQNNLIAHNKFLSDYLQKKLGQSISIQVAENMPVFVHNMEDGQYDFILAPPHVARYSELKLHFQRIAMTTHMIRGVYVVHKDSHFKDLNSLRNKTIIMASPLALLSQGSIQQLRNIGLIDKETVTIKTTSSHKNAIFSVLHKEADAAITGIKLWNDYPERHKKYLKVLAYGDSLPGMMIMGSKRLSNAEIEKMRRFLVEFNASHAGKDYIFQGFKTIDNQSMQQLDAYTNVLK